MIREVIAVPNGEIIKLSPSEGYTYITNGETYSTGLYLGNHDSEANWHDTNDKPPIDDEDATEDDYQNQLERLGVDV